MTGYAAPLTDMRFVLRDLAGLNDIAALPPFREVSEDLVDAILDEAGRFGAGVLAPLNTVGDQQGCRLDNGVVRTPDGFPDAWRQFVAGGWNGIGFSPRVGGQGLPRLVTAAVGEIWTAANMAFGMCPMLTQAAADVIDRFASPVLKEKYLPRMVSGEWTGTMNLTEPQAGSDLARVRTRAARENDHYRISGTKIFITYGDHDLASNIVHLVLARTPDAPEGVKGLSLFLVPKVLVRDDGALDARNDLRCVSLEHKLGIHGSPTALMSFGDGAGAIGYLIGEERHGLELMFRMMNSARLAVGLEGVGIADRAYQQARAYAFERVQGRRLGGDDPRPVAIAHHPDVRRMVLSMRASSEAARALVYFVAADLDHAEHHPDEAERQRRRRRAELLTPVAKAWCTDLGIEVANTAIQVHGGLGYIEESGMPQHLRDARIAAIYEGTNGIQALDLVGRKVARDQGAALAELLAEIKAFLATPALASGELAFLGQRLRAAVADLETATDWLLATFPRQPERGAAGAVHFLRLVGIVTGGWLMTRAAAIARERLASREGDPAFLGSKIAAARFFAEDLLTESGALRTRFSAVGDVLVGADPAAIL